MKKGRAVQKLIKKGSWYRKEKERDEEEPKTDG